MSEVIKNEQIGGFENMNEELKILVKNYLDETDLNKANELKNTIIEKITSSLSMADLSQLKSNLTQMALQETGDKKWKLYELNAGLYNNTYNVMNPKLGNISGSYIPNNEGFFEAPSFVINSGNLSIHGKKIEIGNLGKNYMGNGYYQLFFNEVLEQKNIDELKFREGIIGKFPQSLIIGKDKVFAQDSLGTYEIKTVQISHKKITITLPGFDIKIELNK